MESTISESLVEESDCQDRPLKSPNGDDPIESQSSPRHSFDETHQKSKPNKDHHVDILKEWIKILNNISMSVVTWSSNLLVCVWGHTISVLGEAAIEDDADYLSEQEEVLADPAVLGHVWLNPHVTFVVNDELVDVLGIKLFLSSSRFILAFWLWFTATTFW